MKFKEFIKEDDKTIELAKRLEKMQGKKKVDIPFEAQQIAHDLGITADGAIEGKYQFTTKDGDTFLATDFETAKQKLAEIKTNRMLGSILTK